jgi:hypothetical protein
MWWKGVFAGGFGFPGVQNVVLSVVERGEFVVEVWW